MVPKAINSVIWRIGLFYVGSVVLLVLLLPWNAYQAGQSPFVTFFSKLGVPYIGSVMNIVVLTAALSSLNSGSLQYRAYSALDVDGRLRAEVYVEDEPSPRPLRRDPWRRWGYM